jgi:hypothetical protein
VLQGFGRELNVCMHVHVRTYEHLRAHDDDEEEAVRERERASERARERVY